jgi:GHMP kinases N terminal domain
VYTDSDVPVQSGLGTSSALSVCMTLVTAILAEECRDPTQLAEKAYRFESSVSGCGWQDHFASSIGRPIVILRSSLETLPDLTDPPPAVSEMIYLYGFLVFLSRDPHPPIHWQVRGNEELLLRMDEIVGSVLATPADLSLTGLQEFIRQSWQYARHFAVPDFATTLDQKLRELSNFDACGFIVGSGPAAIIVCADRDGARAKLQRDGLTCRDIYRPLQGVHAVDGE